MKPMPADKAPLQPSQGEPLRTSAPSDEECICSIVLARLPHLNLLQRHTLFQSLGSASLVYAERAHLGDFLPSASPLTLSSLSRMDELRGEAEAELRWARQHHVEVLTLSDPAYPSRLRTCVDAPLVLFYRGTAPLNAPHTLSIVGTRRITPYGQDLCHNLVAEFSRLCPDLLIFSGLAYGVDIHAHRAALDHGLPTVGVLAHGLDRIYPSSHSSTAVRMTHQGGLLTEFMSHTPIDKHHFIQRNRIVAGCSDATLVVESARKGGALITAGIAQTYGRELYACPGRTSDPYSEGCNTLIAKYQATLLSDALQLATAMGWEVDRQRHALLSRGVQQELFPQLSPEEESIVEALRGVDQLQINALSLVTHLSMARLSSLLFNLEMKGIVRLLQGGMYRLVPGPSTPSRA